jgi:hypothetical protein
MPARVKTWFDQVAAATDKCDVDFDTFLSAPTASIKVVTGSMEGISDVHKGIIVSCMDQIAAAAANGEGSEDDNGKARSVKKPRDRCVNKVRKASGYRHMGGRTRIATAGYWHLQVRNPALLSGNPRPLAMHAPTRIRPTTPCAWASSTSAAAVLQRCSSAARLCSRPASSTACERSGIRGYMGLCWNGHQCRAASRVNQRWCSARVRPPPHTHTQHPAAAT